MSLSYCFSRLIRAGNILGAVADSMAEHIGTERKRVTRPPPDGVRERTRRVMDLLYKLDASHHVVHSTRRQSVSELVKDVEILIQMDSSVADRGEFVHYCWLGDGSGRACCKDTAECLQKVKAAYLNLFLCHGCPSGSLSRWTHVGTMFTVLCAGLICRDIFLRAVLRSLPEVAAPPVAGLEPGAAGAGDGDFAAEHSARVHKVRTWLGRAVTRMQVGTMLLLTASLDSVMYFLMGGNAADGARSRRPGTRPRLDEPLPCKDLSKYGTARRGSSTSSRAGRIRSPTLLSC